MIYWLTTFVGVIVFTGLTAYDTQKLKRFASSSSPDEQSKVAVQGALMLYLDFINLFLYPAALARPSSLSDLAGHAVCFVPTHDQANACKIQICHSRSSSRSATLSQQARGPGARESSRVQDAAKDVRSGHDKDGNSEQRPR